MADIRIINLPEFNNIPSDGKVIIDSLSQGTGQVPQTKLADMQGKKVVNMANGTDNTDGANIGQVNTAIQTAIYNSWEGEY